MKIRKIIVTGPTGAVGTALIEEAIKRNINVTAVCRRGSLRKQSIPKNALVSIVECNLDELLSLKGKISNDYDVFYHFGWEGTYGDKRNDLYLQLDNVKYSLDAVKLASSLNCKCFVGAGSQSEYGHIQGTINPYAPCNPDNGYGIAKLQASMMTRILCKKHSIKHIWCRIISLFGPNDGDYTLISTLIRSFLNKERVKTTKGDQIWDYIYSKDAANAFLLAAEKGIDGSIYCLGSGESRSLKEYITAVRDVIDPSLEIGFGEIDYYPNQVMNLQTDISNLQKDTGYRTNYTFEEGIKETVDAYIKQRKTL